MAISGAPDEELTRSVAANLIGQAAAASGLLLAHYEHRVALDAPDEWLDDERPDLVQDTGWIRGVLHEPKYQSFRHDRMVGSYHPGHRAKWTAHELCHGLVGFAWRPGASMLFHALAARLAEVLPVALWYFFDERGLARCAEHAKQGPLFNQFCPQCEVAARRGPLADDPSEMTWVAQGQAFVERELAAIARSQRRGRPCAHRYGHLNLSQDGLAYASAHARRLNSPEFARFVDLFFTGEGQGHHATLESLEARVKELCEALTEDRAPRPLNAGRDLWITQDIAWRLLTVRAQSEGELRDELDRLVERLADAPRSETWASVIADYVACHEEWVLPSPEDVFAVGYDLPGTWGRSLEQVATGLESACPATVARLGGDKDAVVAASVGQDAPQRIPIGRRFARYLGEAEPGLVADLARYESVLSHPAPLDVVEVSLGLSCAGDDRLRLAQGLELIETTGEVLSLLRGEELGDESADMMRYLVIGAHRSGERFVAELNETLGNALRALGSDTAFRSALALSDEEVAELLSLGVLVPVAWTLGMEG